MGRAALPRAPLSSCGRAGKAASLLSPCGCAASLSYPVILRSEATKDL